MVAWQTLAPLLIWDNQLMANPIRSSRTLRLFKKNNFITDALAKCRAGCWVPDCARAPLWMWGWGCESGPPVGPSSP